VGNLAVTELLLQNGAALDCCDSEGRTPLAYCLLFGDTQAAELLLSRGASPP
jgi:ankyrin repeat protein